MLGWRENRAEDPTSPGDNRLMLAQDESPARQVVSGTSSKTLRLLRKRLRQLLRAALVLAIGLAVAASALAIWWLTSLNGLPDIGDPFDVAALRAFSISEDRDAFVFFRRANEKRGSFPLWADRVDSSATTKEDIQFLVGKMENTGGTSRRSF